MLNAYFRASDSFLHCFVNASIYITSIYKTSNGGLVRLVMTGRIFPQMDEFSWERDGAFGWPFTFVSLFQIG